MMTPGIFRNSLPTAIDRFASFSNTRGLWRAREFTGPINSPVHMQRLYSSSVIDQPNFKYPPEAPFFRASKVVFADLQPTVVCNMVPFMLGDKNSLPDQFRIWWPRITSCVTSKNEHREGHLTISQSLVKAKFTRREPRIQQDSGNAKNALYLASSLYGTCRVWNCRVDIPGSPVDYDANSVYWATENNPDNAFAHKENPNNPIDLDADAVYWMTDSVPRGHFSKNPYLHEGYRQFFKLNGRDLRAWWCDVLNIQPTVTEGYCLKPNPLL